MSTNDGINRPTGSRVPSTAGSLHSRRQMHSRAGSSHAEAPPMMRNFSLASQASSIRVDQTSVSPQKSRTGSAASHSRAPSLTGGYAPSSKAPSFNFFATNPFSSGAASVVESKVESDISIDPSDPGIPGVYYRSRRIRKGATDRPELREKDSRDKWITIIPVIGILVGLAAIGLLVWDGWRKVTNHVYCHVFTDDFSRGFNDTIWTKEVELGGYGNGEFEVTTGTEENVFIRDGMLVFKPTLQDESLLTVNSVLNLTADGTCTSDDAANCVAVTNTSTGAIVNPVKSARITTKNFAVIKYGKIEIEAKMARGDWLISSIWMLPAINTYGAWPRSGEIDIAMSRGNNYSDTDGGNNIAQSTLRWGPDTTNNGWWRTNVGHKPPVSTYSYNDKFHTFGLEWSDKYLYTYIDSRLIQVLFVGFDTPFFSRGYFPSTDSNGTKIENPWNGAGTSYATPFDQPFYLILSLAVGGTTGWFTDGVDGKPWADASENANADFWAAKDQWYSTWSGDGAGEFQVKSVKMWQQCD